MIKKHPLQVSVFIVSISLIALFFVTKNGAPSFAEIQFKKISSYAAGTILPASCTSNPPYSHRPNDCITVCSSSPNPLVANNTQYDSTKNACVCKNGKTNAPLCNTPPDPSVKLSAEYYAKPTISITSDAGSNSVETCNGNIYDIKYGRSTTIRWTITDAESCVSSWGGQVTFPTGSFYTGPITVNKPFSLVCTNGTKTATSSRTIYPSPIGSEYPPVDCPFR